MIYRFHPLVCLPLIVGAYSLEARAACEQAQLHEPKAETLAELQPELRWAPIPGASHYRVQLQVKTPEGGTQWSLDTVVSGNTFRTPRPLTRTSAVVKVLVSAGCPDLRQEDLEAQSAAFHVDVTSLCPPLGDVRIDPASARIAWQPDPAHQSIQAMTYAMRDGRLLAQRTLGKGVHAFQVAEPSVVALRPQCQEADGALYLLPVPDASAGARGPG